MAIGLIYGAQSLLMTAKVNGYQIDTAVDNTDWGNPTATIANVASMLMDGDKMVVTRFGNREATIKVRIYGTTLDDVAAGEAVLQGEINRGLNTLTWQPPGTSTASVFDVIYGDLGFQFDSYSENGLVMRTFVLTLVCLPFARRATQTVVVAAALPAAAPTVTSIDPCTSVTGWASPTGSIALSDASTAVRQTTTTPATVLAQMTKTGLSAAIAVGEYVMVEISTSNSNTVDYVYDDLKVYLNGSTTPAVLQAAVASASGVSTTYYFPRPAATLTSVKVAETTLPSPAYITVHDISKSTGLPFTGTNAQRSFALTVGGTARTAADLTVETPTGKIGEEGIVYTYKPGTALYPPLRNTYLTSAGAAATSGTVTNAANDFTAPAVFTIPAAAIPAGNYSLVVRARHTSTATVTLSWTATTTGVLTNTTLNQSGSAALGLSTSWIHGEIGVLTLPTVAVGAGSAANVVLTVSASAAAASWDEIWLFNLDNGDLTRLVVPTSGSTGSKMIISSATLLGSPNPAWKIGTQGTTANDIDAGDRIVAPGVHQIMPGILSVFVVTPGAGSGGQIVTGALYERFKHNVTAP